MLESGWQPTQEEANEILRKRAEELASRDISSPEKRESMYVVEFMLGQEKYGIEASFLKEVIRLNGYTALPGTPDFIIGIINVRGSIVPLMNIRKFFGIPETGLSNSYRALIINNEKIETGIIADDVAGVLELYREELQPPLSTMRGINRGLYSRNYKRQACRS